MRKPTSYFQRLVEQRRQRAFNSDRGPDAGDTLVEVLLAVVVVGIAAVALLAAFATAITASAQHRNLTSLDSSTRIAANDAVADVQQQAQAQAGQPDDPFACPATPFTPSFSNLPSGFQATPTVTYWTGNSSTGFQSGCIAYAPQEYTLQVSSARTPATQVTTVVYDPAAPPCPNSPNNCAGAPAKLVWIQQPTGGSVGTPITPQPEVAVEDANGNIVSNDFSSVTLQVVSGPGTVSGSCVGAESYGIAQFSSCSLSAAGLYTLQANDSNPAVTSTPQVQITVTAAPAAKLVFISTAVNGSASASASLPSSGQITVQQQDAFGNAVNATSPVPVTLSSSSTGSYIFNTTKGATTPTGLTTVTIPSGQSSVTFYYGDKKAGTPVLSASAPGLATGTQAATIAALTTVSQLGFTTNPFTAPAGNSASTAFTIALEDQFGNPITRATNTTVNLSSNSKGSYIFNTTKGLTTPTGATTVTINSGNPSASVYYGDTSSGNPVITASVTGQPTWTATQTETVTAGPTKLVFTTPPQTGSAYTSAIIGPITVQEQTAAGVPTTVGETVTLSSNSSGTYIFNPTFGATSPTGSTTVTIPAGSSSVSFYYGDTKAGSPSIMAAATGLTSASQPETVNVGPVAAFALSTPGAPVAGTSFTETITAVDAGGNTVTSFGGAGGTSECLTLSGAASSPNGTAPLYPPLGTCQSGTSAITFTNGVGMAAVTLYNAQPTKLQATQGAITGSTNSFNVSAGSAAAFSLSTIPQSAGVAFSQSISATDQWGNPTSSYAGTKCLTFSGPSSSPAPTSKAPAYPAQGGSCATGQSSVTFTAGIGTPSITLYDAQTTTLTAKSGSLTGTSASFTVAAGPLTTLTVANPGPQIAGTAFNVHMTGVDQWSNGISATLTPTFSGPSNAPNGTTPSYPGSVTFTNGTATSSITLFDAQSTTLKVTSGSISGTSPSFTVSAGAITSITATSGGSQSATVNTAFTNKLVAALVDNWANGVSGVSVTFTVPASGASATFGACASNTATTCTQTTGANGQATSSTFTANAINGAYNIAASASGVNPATYAETNVGNQTVSFTSTAPAGAKVGGSSYTPTATATSGLAVTITVDSSSSSICSIGGGVVSFQAAGTCKLDANQAGNSIWNPAPQVQQSFTVGKGSQTVSFTSTAPANATVGGASYTPTATATSGLGVAITVDSSSTSICSIAGGVVSFQAVGTCTLDANQAGNASWNAAPQVQQSFAVAKGNQTITFTSTAPGGAVVNGATYTATATATSGLVPVTFSSGSTSVCTSSGTNGSVFTFVGAGTCVVDANQAGNTTWNAAPQAQQSFAVGKGNQTITFTSTAPGGAVINGATYTATATASSGLTPVTFTSGSTSVCTSSGTNGSVFTFVSAGTCVVDANQAGNANWNAAPQAQQSFAVAKGNQTVTLHLDRARRRHGWRGHVHGGRHRLVGAHSSHVHLRLDVGVHLERDQRLGLHLRGCRHVHRRRQPNGQRQLERRAAGPAELRGCQGQPDRQLHLDRARWRHGWRGHLHPDGHRDLGAWRDHHRRLVEHEHLLHRRRRGQLHLERDQRLGLHLRGCGHVHRRRQPGRQRHLERGAPGAAELRGAKGNQTVSFTSTAPGGATVGGATYTATATASSGLTPVTFSSGSTSVCTSSGTNGSVFTFVGAGTCIVDANQTGNANWNAAPQVQQSFTVGKGSQAVSFTSTAPANATVGGTSYTPTATATSGLGVTITVDSSSSSICSISGGVVNFEAVGTCTLDANQAGNANWNAAPQVQQSFAVAKGNQTISFTSTAPGGATVGGATYTPTATATSGLTPAITVDSSSTSICSIAGGVVSFQAVGTCKLDANQAGNANWNAAAQVQQSFAVGKGSQTMSFTSSAPTHASVGGASYTPTATATSGLAVTITVDSSSSSICSISGGVVSFQAAGTCKVDANQAGNAHMERRIASPAELHRHRAHDHERRWAHRWAPELQRDRRRRDDRHGDRMYVKRCVPLYGPQRRHGRHLRYAHGIVDDSQQRVSLSLSEPRTGPMPRPRVPPPASSSHSPTRPGGPLR